MPFRLAKEQDFLNLKQGTLSVSQYAAKYEELSCYALNSIPTKDKKARRFEWGLTTARRTVVAQGFTTYAEVVKCALWLESVETDFKTRCRKANNSTSGPIQTEPPSNNRGPYPTKPSNLPQSNQPWGTATFRRSEPQRGKRDLMTVRCYNCQSMGHYSRQCPQPQKEGNGSFGQTGFVKQNLGGPSQQKSKGKQPIRTQQGTGGRIFALQTEEQEQDPAVIQGICVQALFDSGASHSFISIACVTALALETEPLSTNVEVTSPLGGNVAVSLVCRGCELEVANLRRTCDLKVINMADFNVIPRMDWLSTDGELDNEKIQVAESIVWMAS
ncbi:uncharacterized protein LOC131306879 [Rhododendron vialii]|uniref:uncharacterized protein LOC131306879 n=1 Tax=Rhododendron vialii TaxID=182163 RepID=UPI00265E9ECA|nr:uncharacterized protein LOC131306879 [Rhododendron vialii]